MTPPEIVVVAEHLAGEVTDVTLEMLACARELTHTIGWHVTCVILADDPKPFEALPLASGRTVIVQDPSLSSFNPVAYSKVLAHVLRDLGPRLVLVGNTNVGTDLAGSLSHLLDAPVVGGCIRIRSEGEGILFTSRMCGGKLLAQIEFRDGMAIAMLLPGSFNREEGMQDQVPPTEVRPSPVSLKGLPVRFLELVEPSLGDVDVRKVPILVAAGRGVQSKANLEAVEALAKTLGGAVCATRPIVDQGWLPRARQVGRSGMIVKPRLYLALGVSGAPEHVEGMKESGLIVAVNTDPEAPIFDVAHFGATVDLLKLVPILAARIEAAKGGA